MKQKFIFKNFLTNNRTYTENRTWWKRVIEDIVRSSNLLNSQTYPINFDNRFKTAFVSGHKFNDGNPIIEAVWTQQNKALRIIQEEPESDHVEIGAWIEKIVAGKFGAVEELVISLELTNGSVKIAEKLIEKWIHGQLNEKTIGQIINTFKSETITSASR